MEVTPDSSHSALLEGCSKQQEAGMITKYYNKSPFTFVMFSEVTEAVCEERNTLTPTECFNSAVDEEYIEQNSQVRQLFYTGK